MDDPFAGSIMPQSAAPAGPSTGDDPFAGSIQDPNYQPPTPETRYGWSDIPKAFASGMHRGVGEALQTFGAEGPGEGHITGDEPFQLSDIWHPATGLTKMAERIGASGPTTGGGIAGATMGSMAGPAGSIGGGMLGAATGAAIQTFGPALARELKATPDDKDGAWQRAVNSTLMSGGASAAAWGLMPLRILGGPIKSAVFQALGVQPGIAMAHQAGENIQHGRNPLEGTGQAYVEGAASTLPTAAGTAAGRVVGRFLGKGDQTAQGVAGKPVKDRSAEDLFKIGEDHYSDIDEWGKAGGLDYTNKPELEKLSTEITNRLNGAGGNPKYGPLGKDIYGIVGDLKDAGKFKDVNDVRKMLNGYLRSNEPNVQRLAKEAISGVDEWLQHPGKQINAGVAPELADQLGDKIKIANSYWKAGKAMEAWDKVQDRIDTASNPEARRRVEVNRIVNNPKVNWQYPREAIDMMRASLKDPGLFMKTMRTITKPFDPHSSTGLIADFLLHHFTGPMGVAAPLISALTRHAVQKPLEATTKGVPHYIRHVPEIKAGNIPSMPRYKGADIIRPEGSALRPAFQPQPQMQEGGEVPVGDFTEALDPHAELLPNYPGAPDDAMTGPPVSPQPLTPPRPEPTMGDFMEALNPKPELTGGSYGSPDPALMSPQPTPRPDLFQPPLPQARPPAPMAAPGQGKGAPVPYAAPGVGGKGAAPTALRLARHQHRRHYQEGGGDEGPDIPEAEQAQQARDAAAQRMQTAVGPSPTQPREVPQPYQSWGNLAEGAAQSYPQVPQDIHDIPDWIRANPETIGSIGMGGMFLPASKTLAATAESGLRKGMSPHEMWDLMGTFKDAGGDWRTEAMGPTQLKIDPYSPFKGSLGEAYDNPALYSKMPEMARMPFELKKPQFDPYDTTLGQYYPQVGSQPAMIEARTLRQGEEFPNQLLETIAHEGQHGVDQRAGLLRNVAGDHFWHAKGLKGETNNPQWRQYVDELTPFFKGDRERASVSAEMGTVPDLWHKAAKQAVDFDRYKRSIHEVMARLTGRREDLYNVIHGMEGPKAAQRDLRSQVPFSPTGTSGYDVPAEMQLFGKKYSKAKAPQSKGGAAKKAVALARR